MILTPEFILNIMENIEKESTLEDCVCFMDDAEVYRNRWEVLKKRIENLKVLRGVDFKDEIKTSYRCEFWDCGWCYRDNSKYAQGGCVGQDKCDYMKG